MSIPAVFAALVYVILRQDPPSAIAATIAFSIDDLVIISLGLMSYFKRLCIACTDPVKHSRYLETLPAIFEELSR